METEIIGREKEIEKMNKLLSSPKSEFLAIYGRRRVGKTFLIREHFKSHTVFSFTGSFEVETKIQLQNFFSEYMKRTKGAKETTVPKNWIWAFNYLADYIYKLPRRKKKAVIFIDELPWLDRPRSGFVQALEYFWNQHISTLNNVVLVVCGSAASWMQNKLIKAKGGLHNRITARIKLQAFNLYETELFCKNRNLKLSKYQIVQLYMTMGGIPFYLNELSPGKSAEQLIDEICFNPLGLLSTEYEQLYFSLFKNAENHHSIIEALAQQPNGMTRPSLLNNTSLPDGGTFTRTLNDLLESGFISSSQPFIKKKKETIYRLTDLYSLFYLKFIKGNVNDSLNTWQRISSQSSFKAWSGYAYENICMLHTNQIISKLGLGGTYTRILSWKHIGNDETPGAQIDLLIDRKDGMINLCEAKFAQDEFIISKDYNAVLRRKRSIFKNVTKTKKSVVSTLISTYPAIKNKYYLEEIHSEISMVDLFKDIK